MRRKGCEKNHTVRKIFAGIKSDQFQFMIRNSHYHVYGTNIHVYGSCETCEAVLQLAQVADRYIVLPEDISTFY